MDNAASWVEPIAMPQMPLCILEQRKEVALVVIISGSEQVEAELLRQQPKWLHIRNENLSMAMPHCIYEHLLILARASALKLRCRAGTGRIVYAILLVSKGMADCIVSNEGRSTKLESAIKTTGPQLALNPDIWDRVNWSFKNRDYKEAAARRRELEWAPEGAHSKAEWGAILDNYGRKCLRCGIHESQTRYGKLTKDHVVPLCHGGSDYASNLQPLCSICNTWKGRRMIDYRGQRRIS
jgi:hypothetical protein